MDELPDNGNYPDKTTEPWWNDGDKVGGIFATVVMILGLAILVSAVAFGIIKFYQQFI